MCGIAGLLLSPEDLQRVSVEDMVKTLALEIESRGRDATGVGRLSKGNRLVVTKAPVKATEFMLMHPGIGSGCRLVLVHTRAWTRGDPKVNANNHPITCGPITGIHNGIVSNADALYGKYNWQRVAEVDSEAIFAALHHLDSKEALELLSGSIACAWHDIRKPGHLFVARHTSNPLNVGISDSGSVIFASTNTAVAKAAAQLGASKIDIDPIKEGVMCEFWIDDDGKLASDITEFTPPRTYYRQGSWEYDRGGWLPRGRVNTSLPQGTTTSAKASSTVGSGVIRNDGWGVGAGGFVLKTGDQVVFEPVAQNCDVVFGRISHWGVKQQHVWVELEFDVGVVDEIMMPLKQLWPLGVWLQREKDAKQDKPVLELLPKVKVESDLTDWDKLRDGGIYDVEAEETEDLEDDFWCPRSTTELIQAIEEVFGEEALDLLPGYEAWIRGDLPEMEFGEVIDVEEVENNG